MLVARSEFQLDEQRDKGSSLVAHWFGACANCHVETRAIPFGLHCPSLSEETLKVVGPFHLVSVSGQVKDPMQGGNGQNWSQTH